MIIVPSFVKKSTVDFWSGTLFTAERSVHTKSSRRDAGALDADEAAMLEPLQVVQLSLCFGLCRTSNCQIITVVTAPRLQVVLDVGSPAAVGLIDVLTDGYCSHSGQSLRPCATNAPRATFVHLLMDAVNAVAATREMMITFFMLVSPRARREGMRPAEGCELPSVPCWMIVY
jgi:hypothetical protein